MFCKKCGTKIDKDIEFCPNCGTPLKLDLQKSKSEKKNAVGNKILKGLMGGGIIAIIVVGSFFYSTHVLKDTSQPPSIIEETSSQKDVKPSEQVVSKTKELADIKYDRLTEETFGFSFDYPDNLPRPDLYVEDSHSAVHIPLALNNGFVGVDFGGSSDVKQSIQKSMKESNALFANAKKYEILSDNSYILYFDDGKVVKVVLGYLTTSSDRGKSSRNAMRYYMGFKIKGELSDESNKVIKHVLDSFNVKK